MTVEAKDVRKVVVLGWDNEEVRGSTASIQVEGQEKRVVENDGEANIYFPLDWTGEVEVTIAGSHSGEDSGTVVVT